MKIITIVLSMLSVSISCLTITRQYKLDTQYSSLHVLRDAYLCNYDDTKKSVTCYKVSLTDTESVTSLVVAAPGSAYEVCGLKLGKGFIGSFKRPTSGSDSASSRDDVCSVWLSGPQAKTNTNHAESH